MLRRPITLWKLCSNSRFQLKANRKFQSINRSLGLACLREVSTLGLEPIFIGHIRHSVNNTISSSIRELPPNGYRFVFRSGILQLAGFLLRNSVAGFIPERVNQINFRLTVNRFTYAKLYPSTPILSLSYLTMTASASLCWGAARTTAKRVARATTWNHKTNHCNTVIFFLSPPYRFHLDWTCDLYWWWGGAFGFYTGRSLRLTFTTTRRIFISALCMCVKIARLRDTYGVSLEIFSSKNVHVQVFGALGKDELLKVYWWCVVQRGLMGSY